MDKFARVAEAMTVKLLSNGAVMGLRVKVLVAGGLQGWLL